MAHDTLVTVSGFVATSPRLVVGESGIAFCAFRMASTPRRYDRSSDSWSDGQTEWFTVKTFGESAENVGHSLHKGDPVLVYGKLKTSEWTAEDGAQRTGLDIVTIAVGHDAHFGVSNFVRAVRHRTFATEPQDERAAAGMGDDGVQDGGREDATGDDVPF